MMNQSPFLPSLHGHPNFNPNKNVQKNLEAAKNPKQPKPPDKPVMPYMRYSKKVWDDVRLQYPDLKVWEVGKIVGQMWRDLNENEKQKYIDEFEMEKIEYNELLKQYHSTPAYQAWILSKVKENEDRESPKRKDKKKESNNVHNSPQKPENRFSIQSLEADESEEYYSNKHLAAARYYRNNELINEIFSDIMINDDRNFDYETRLKQLRVQADSLITYRKRLNDEIQQLEEKFQQKKNALKETSGRFNHEFHRRFLKEDFDATIKEHYRRTLMKTLEFLKESKGNNHIDNAAKHNHNQNYNQHQPNQQPVQQN